MSAQSEQPPLTQEEVLERAEQQRKARAEAAARRIAEQNAAQQATNQSQSRSTQPMQPAQPTQPTQPGQGQPMMHGHGYPYRQPMPTMDDMVYMSNSINMFANVIHAMYGNEENDVSPIPDKNGKLPDVYENGDLVPPMAANTFNGPCSYGLTFRGDSHLDRLSQAVYHTYLEATQRALMNYARKNILSGPRKQQEFISDVREYIRIGRLVKEHLPDADEEELISRICGSEEESQEESPEESEEEIQEEPEEPVKPVIVKKATPAKKVVPVKKPAPVKKAKKAEIEEADEDDDLEDLGLGDSDEVDLGTDEEEEEEEEEEDDLESEEEDNDDNEDEDDEESEVKPVKHRRQFARRPVGRPATKSAKTYGRRRK